jgi:DNA-directed RNA polymerase subunit RPC12/RpoP
MRCCPDCGVRNPNFKDETKCARCDMHLGAYEEAKALEKCPFCGASGKVLVRIKTSLENLGKEK